MLLAFSTLKTPRDRAALPREDRGSLCLPLPLSPPSLGLLPSLSKPSFQGAELSDSTGCDSPSSPARTQGLHKGEGRGTRLSAAETGFANCTSAGDSPPDSSASLVPRKGCFEILHLAKRSSAARS